MTDYLPLSLLPTLEQRAVDILQRWGLPSLPPVLVKYRENAVFRVARSIGSFAGLRLHRPGHHDRAALLSEMLWMQALHAGGLAIPEPIPTTSGELLVTVQVMDDGPVQFADLLTWLPGAPLGDSDRPLAHGRAARLDLFHKLGATIGRLHRLSDDWSRPEDFRRPTWDQAGLLGENPIWGRFWDCPELPQADAEKLQALRTRLCDSLQRRTEKGLDYGLIHADLVRENVLVHEGNVSIIDFDEAGFGFRLFDIASALLKNRAEPDYADIERALIAGYRDERALSEQELSALPLFMTLRSLAYVGWIAARADVPGATTRLSRSVAEALALSGLPGGEG